MQNRYWKTNVATAKLRFIKKRNVKIFLFQREIILRQTSTVI